MRSARDGFGYGPARAAAPTVAGPSPPLDGSTIGTCRPQQNGELPVQHRRDWSLLDTMLLFELLVLLVLMRVSWACAVRERGW